MRTFHPSLPPPTWPCSFAPLHTFIAYLHHWLQYRLYILYFRLPLISFTSMLNARRGKQIIFRLSFFGAINSLFNSNFSIQIAFQFYQSFLIHPSISLIIDGLFIGTNVWILWNKPPGLLFFLGGYYLMWICFGFVFAATLL